MDSMGDAIMFSLYMMLLDHTQASEQGRQSPHLDGQLYRILHTHQI